MSKTNPEYFCLADLADVPEHCTLDDLKCKMLGHLNDLRAYGYYYINEVTINKAERSMLKAFKTRSNDDINQYWVDLMELNAQAQRSQNLAFWMSGLMIASVALSLAAMPVFLPSYLNMISMPIWVDIFTMTIFTATTIVYLGCQAIQSQSLTSGKLSLFRQDCELAKKGLDDGNVKWQAQLCK